MHAGVGVQRSRRESTRRPHLAPRSTAQTGEILTSFSPTQAAPMPTGSSLSLQIGPSESQGGRAGLVLEALLSRGCSPRAGPTPLQAADPRSTWRTGLCRGFRRGPFGCSSTEPLLSTCCVLGSLQPGPGGSEVGPLGKG